MKKSGKGYIKYSFLKYRLKYQKLHVKKTRIHYTLEQIASTIIRGLINYKIILGILIFILKYIISYYIIVKEKINSEDNVE